MTIGLVGRKVGMMRIFTDEGDAQPVTVLDVSDNRITQIKTADKDGYSAVQVAFGKRRASRVKKPLAGHLAKAAVEAGHTLREFRAEAEGARQPEGRRQDRRRDLQGRADGGRAGHHDRQGLRRRHQAPPLLLEPRNPRQLDHHAHPGLDRPAPGSGPRVPRQAHGRPPRQQAPHDPEPGRGAHRRRAPAAAGQGLGTGLLRAATSSCGRRSRARRSRGPEGRAAQGRRRSRRRRPDHGTQTDRTTRARRARWPRKTRFSRATSTRR